MKSNPEAYWLRDLPYCSHKPVCIGTTNPDRLVLITIITWHFQFHPMNVSNLHLKGANMCSKREPFHALVPLLRHMAPLNDGNFRLTIPVVKEHCAREALARAFNFGVFKYGKSNLTTKNEPETLNESCVTLPLTAIIGGIFQKQWASSTDLTTVSKFRPRLPAQWAVGTHRKGSSRMEKTTSRMNWPIRNSTLIRHWI